MPSAERLCEPISSLMQRSIPARATSAGPDPWPAALRRRDPRERPRQSRAEQRSAEGAVWGWGPVRACRRPPHRTRAEPGGQRAPPPPPGPAPPAPGPALPPAPAAASSRRRLPQFPPSLPPSRRPCATAVTSERAQPNERPSYL